MSTDWTCFASWSSHHRVHQEVQELSQEVLDMGMFIAECAPLQIEVGSTEAVPPSYLRPFLSLRPLPQLRPLCPLYPLCHLRPLRPLHSREYLASGGNLYLHHARTNAKEVVWRLSSWRVNFRVAAERRGKIRGRGHFFHRRAATKVNGGNWGWGVGFSYSR